MSGIAGQVLQAVRLDRGDRGARLAAGRALLTPMMAAYLLKPPTQDRERRSGWMQPLPAAGSTGACATAGDDHAGRRCSSSARCCWCRCCPPASSRRPTWRRRSSPRAAARQHARADLARRPSRRARSIAGRPARQAGLHRDRRRQRRQRSVRARRRAEVRKATLTLNLTPRERARPASQAGRSRARPAHARWRRCPGVRSTGRLRRLRREATSLGARPATTPQRCWTHAAQAVERELRTPPRPRHVASTASLIRPEIVVGPTPRAPPTSASPAAAIAETLRIATAGDYDQAWPS